MLCLRSMRPARLATATRVPMLSKRSTKRKTKMISKAPTFMAPRRSRWSAVAVMARGSKAMGCQWSWSDDEAEQHGSEHAEQHSGADVEDLEHGDEGESEEGERGGGVVEIAERDGGGGAGDDDAGVAEADEGDEEADAPGDGGMELVRDGGDQALADAGEGEDEEDDAGEEDGAEGGLPRHAHAFDHGVGEVGVESHAGGEREGIVGEAHP